MKQIIAEQVDHLQLPPEVNRPRLLAALAMVESNGGRNLQPNFEPSFYKGGYYWNPHLNYLRAKWGARSDPRMRQWSKQAMACSWGPWQILYVTAEELGYKGPPWALTDPSTCLGWAIKLINKRLASKLAGPLTEMGVVERIADGYNSGSFRDKFVPHSYIKKILGYYEDEDVLEKLLDLKSFCAF